MGTQSRHAMPGLVLLVLYAIAVTLPLILIVVLGIASPNGLVFELGRAFALCGFVIIALQPVLSARLKWIERPFGLDMVSRFHKRMGLFAAILLICHPLLLAVGGSGPALLTSLTLPWYIWVGKGTLLLVLVQTSLALLWPRLGLTFESWRRYHFVLPTLILPMAFVHSWVTGQDLAAPAMQVYWIALLAAGGSAFVYHKAIKPWTLKQRPWTVSAVERQSDNVWTVKVVPPKGCPVYYYMPGQFHFVTFYRDPSLPVEEHHWTISSSPTQEGFVSSTIKESGDFTATIGKTKPGDTAVVDGPYGRFSYTLYPDCADLVFIAGGIGITPLVAMLRHMKDVRARISVVLIYANKSEKDIVFRGELSEIEAGDWPDLKVVHVLSHPGQDWRGESGRVNGRIIEAACGPDLISRVYYVCCPPGMTEAVVKILRARRIPDAQIQTERFSL